MPSSDRIRTKTPGVFYRGSDRDRRYQITYNCHGTCPKHASGRGQHWEAVHGDYEAARGLLAQRKAEVKERRGARQRGEAVERRFGEVVDEWRRSTACLELEGSTRRRYEKDLRNYVLPAFEDMPVGDMTAKVLQRWIDGLRTRDRGRAGHRDRGLMVQTIRGARTAVSAVLRFAAEREYIAANPARGLRLPKSDTRPVRVLDADELALLFEHAPERSRLAFRLMAATGARDSEALALAWCDLDLDAGRVTFTRALDEQGHGKPVKTAGSLRSRPLPASLADELRALRVYRGGFGVAGPNDRVLLDLTLDRLGRDFKRARAAAGIDAFGKRLSPYSLRHGYGSWLIAQGRPLPYVSRAMGHASQAFTARTYLHEFESQTSVDDARCAQDMEELVR
jgi:integrase